MLYATLAVVVPIMLFGGVCAGLAIAFALESVLLAWLPAEEVALWLGAGSGLLAVPLAVTIGVITYINSFAAVPPVSGLIDRPWHEPGNGPRFYACRRGNERAR